MSNGYQMINSIKRHEHVTLRHDTVLALFLLECKESIYNTVRDPHTKLLHSAAHCVTVRLSRLSLRVAV
jgi:hypothetical protein